MVTGFIPSFFLHGQQTTGYKKKKKMIGSYLFSSIKLYTAGILQNCHLEARTNLKKMPNTILPLVILTWLRQLQEHFYEIGDNKESGDWNVHGKYCAVRAKNVSKDFPLDNVPMMKANSTSVVEVKKYARRYLYLMF